MTACVCVHGTVNCVRRRRNASGSHSQEQKGDTVERTDRELARVGITSQGRTKQEVCVCVCVCVPSDITHLPMLYKHHVCPRVPTTPRHTAPTGLPIATTPAHL